MNLIKPSFSTGYAKNASESANPNLWKGLVGAWMPSFGVTGNTLKDVSGNGNDGTLQFMDAASDWVATRKGLALDFDGTGGNIVSLPEAFSLGGFHSFSTTIRFDAFNSVVAGGGSSNHYLLYVANANTLYYRDNNGFSIISTTANLEIGKQHHIAVTRKNSTVKSFVDGVFKGSGQRFGTAIINTIGGYPNTAASVNGQISSASIYNRALSPSEIKQLYVDSLAPFRTKKRTVVRVPAAIPAATVVGSIKKPTTIIKPSYQAGYARNASESENPNLWDGLVGAWMPSFGVTGETLRDVSGNGNHGTLTNMDASSDWVATSKGLALDFDGSNDVVLSRNLLNGLAVDRGLTFTACIKPDSLASQGFISGVWGQSRTLDQAGFFVINSGVLVAVNGGTGDESGFGVSNTLTTGEWQFIAGTWTYDGVYKVYQDGRFLGSGYQSTSGFLSSSPIANFHIGSQDTTGFRAFDGSISNTSIYNRALSPTEIKQLYVDSLAPFRRKQRVSVAVPAATPTPSATYHPLRSLAHPLEQ